MPDLMPYPLIPISEEPFNLDDRKFVCQTDDYFRMGSAHHVCQDYSRSDKGMALLSDGCSSAQDTDFGARFMVMAARFLLSPLGKIMEVTADRLVRDGQESCYNLSLPYSCLDATLLAAFQESSGMIKVQAFGDGVIVVRTRSGDLWVYDIDQDGAPAYPPYFVIPGRMQTYKEAGYGARHVRVLKNGQQVLTLEWAPDMLETEQCFQFRLDPREVDLIILMSDGAKSFQDISGLSPKEIPLEAVLPYLIGFKTMTGAFVGRRVNAFLTKEMPKFNWRHYDDLAVAALYVEEVSNAGQ